MSLHDTNSTEVREKKGRSALKISINTKPKHYLLILGVIEVLAICIEPSLILGRARCDYIRTKP